MGYTRIKAIRKEAADPRTFAGSLLQNGFSRMPGTSVKIGPHRERDGRYRTGLDEDAQYIKALPTEEQEIERERVKALRLKLEKETGLDLSPNSTFYADMYGVIDDGKQRAASVSLKDEDLLLDDNEPMAQITKAWVIVHPIVARSLADYKAGKANAEAGWYVSDPEGETQEAYRQEMALNKAKSTLNELTPSQLIRIARLMELSVSADSSPEHTYILINKELTRGKFLFGTYKNKSTIKVFNELNELSETTLALKDLVKRALSLSIYRKAKTGEIMQGTEKIADSEDDLVKDLASSTEDRVALEGKVNSKSKLHNS